MIKFFEAPAGSVSPTHEADETVKQIAEFHETMMRRTRELVETYKGANIPPSEAARMLTVVQLEWAKFAYKLSGLQPQAIDESLARIGYET